MGSTEMIARRQRANIERDARRLRVAELYLRNIPQIAIAEQLGVVQSTISRDLAALRAEWQASAQADFADQQALELARIDNLERMYHEAWRRSLENGEVEVVEQIGSRGKTKAGGDESKEPVIIPERNKKYKRVEGRSGNPAFLAGVLDCISKRCEIRGLYASKDITSGGKPLAPVQFVEVTMDMTEPVEPTEEEEEAYNLTHGTQ